MEEGPGVVLNSNFVGYDGISTKLLKISSHFITSPLTHICNKSTGCLKKIVPFFIFFLGAQCVESGVSCIDYY
jgi:hypothetical protein